MLGLSASHLVILGVVMLIFGAKRLPEIGSSLGKGLRSFKRGLEGIDEEEVKPLESPKNSISSKDHEAP